jgi:hypothetical protein
MKPVNLSLTRESAELILRALIEMPFKQVNQLVHYIDHEILVSQQQMPANTVTVVGAQGSQPIAKWGYKKDGSIKKAPGRQPRKAQ